MPVQSSQTRVVTPRPVRHPRAGNGHEHRAKPRTDKTNEDKRA